MPFWQYIRKKISLAHSLTSPADRTADRKPAGGFGARVNVRNIINTSPELETLDNCCIRYCRTSWYDANDDGNPDKYSFVAIVIPIQLAVGSCKRST